MLEGQDGGVGSVKSPGGFTFGIEGWNWAQPIPKSITFFTDGSAMVCDQYGRHIRRAVGLDGAEVHFADTPPAANTEGVVVPRPQYADHAQVIAALAADRFNWLDYEVRYRDRGGNKVRPGLTLEAANKLRDRLIKDGTHVDGVFRSITCAGWPQLPYDELLELDELPPTPIEELKKIPNAQLRKDALRIRREKNEAMAKELQAAEVE